MRFQSFALISVLAVFAQGAAAASVWNESVDGDLSNDRANPTPLTLAVGSNSITGSVTSRASATTSASTWRMAPRSPS